MPNAAEVWKPLVEKLTAQSEDYGNFHDYWVGDNDLPVESSEFQSRFGTLFEDYRDNLARPIIKTAESRVRIVGFGDGEGLAVKAQEVWDDNNMNLQSQYVHIEAMVKGDGYVLVLPKSDGSPGIWPQISESCVVLYDEVMPADKVAALKWWVTTVGEKGVRYVRANIYFEDRIERYISTSSTSSLVNDFSKYEQFNDEDGGWKSNHTVGEVPMFELNVNYDLSTGVGRSDLADAIGPIDAVNKSMLDMLTASEFTAAPQRYATGVEIPIDPQTGEPLEAYKSGKQKLWTAPNDGARFGQFTAGDMKGYRESVDLLVDHLAFTTATPAYALMKQVQYPSGEALRSAEAPLRGRVSDHQDAFGPVWQDVIAAAIALDGVSEIKGVARKQIKPKFLPVNAPFATAEFMEELKVKAETLGVPEEKLWMEAGYTADEIEVMKAMRDEEAALGVDAAFDQQAIEIVPEGIPAEQAVGGVALDTTPEAEEDAASALEIPQ